MLNKKSIKIISIILIAVIVLFTIANATCMAVTIPEPDDNASVGGVSSVVTTILGIIKWAGAAIAVGMLMFIGIKYVTASPDGKAEIKKTAIIYVLGAVLIFSASAILGIIQTNLTVTDTNPGNNGSNAGLNENIKTASIVTIAETK